MNWEEFEREFGDHPGYTEQLQEPRVLRASWTRELAGDLASVHGLDVEDLLAEILSEEIATEMNLNPILIPTVRRAMPQLLASQIAEVQPMTGIPSGLTFGLSYNTESGRSNVTVSTLKTREWYSKQDYFKEEEDLFKL